MKVYDSALQFQWPHIRNFREDHKGIQRAHCPEWNLTCEYSNRGFRKPSKSSRAAFRLFLTKKLSKYNIFNKLAELREKNPIQIASYPVKVTLEVLTPPQVVKFFETNFSN